MKNIGVGHIVLLKEEKAMPAVWKQGRVVEVYPDGQGQERNVLVFTGGKETKRAVQSLVVLPMED